MSMKVTIEDAGLGDEPIVYEFDTAEVSVVAHGSPLHGEISIKYRTRLPSPPQVPVKHRSRPVATRTVASQATHDEA
jgi:hypothetical protein